MSETDAERQRIADDTEIEIQDAIGALKASLVIFMEALPADDAAQRERAQTVYDMVSNLQRKLLRRARLG